MAKNKAASSITRILNQQAKVRGVPGAKATRRAAKQRLHPELYLKKQPKRRLAAMLGAPPPDDTTT
jgi:hypothetical protein